MTIQTIGNVLLIILAVGWIGFRQLTWRPVSIRRMWRVPLIMAIIGVVLLVQSTNGAKLTTLDIAVLAVEIAISLGVGAWMGAIAHFRPLKTPITDPDHAATMESRTGWWGLALWILVLGTRVGIDFFAVQAGSHLATSTGIILLLLAANRASRTAVFAIRVDRMAAVAA